MTEYHLAFFGLLLWVLISIPLVRLYKGEKFFRPMALVFAILVLAYTFLFFRAIPPMEFGGGLLFFTLAYLASQNFIHGSFLTGFSSEILMKILDKKEAGMTVEELLQNYSGESGTNLWLQKRIRKLVEGNYVEPLEKDSFRLLPKGKMIAKSTLLIQKLLKMGTGG